ncbi:hypothetical protein Tco_1444563 [Tanacetum coccineum]
MMDKSWMKANITTNTFKDGVKSFIDFASVGAIRGEISCPCNKCGHAEWFLVDVVHHHILQHGFLSGYTHWTFHGELDTTPPISQPASVLDTSPVIDNIRGLVRDSLGVNSLDSKSEESSESRLEGDIDGDIEGYIEEESEEDIEEESEEDIKEESDEDSEEDIGDKDIRYKKLLEEYEKELYQRSKYCNLSFTLRLYHIKCIGGISNKIFSMILELIKDASPHLSSLPSSNNEAKKLTHDLGLGYKKWMHVLTIVCFTGVSGNLNNHVIFAMLLDIKVILKRLYMSEKTAKDMRWHNMGRTMDGKLRHPADGLAWKGFDARYLKFAFDPYSVRLGLASDGFNPFCTMSTSYSMWPVVLIPYNLPPWICMKQQSLILSSIIPGGKALGDDIDIY